MICLVIGLIGLVRPISSCCCSFRGTIDSRVVYLVIIHHRSTEVINMSYAGYFESLIIGVLLFICISYISFVDLLSILLKIIPLKNPEGFDEHKKLMDSELYVNHKKKWIKIYLSSPLVYTFILTLLVIITKNIMFGFLIGLLTTFILVYGVIGNKEYKDRQKIQKEIRNIKSK